MKKIITSAGLAALGISTLHGQQTFGLNKMETAKPWSVSAALRGFYDDNYATASTREQKSYGFEINPSASLNLLPSDQTYVGLSYIYSLRWYENRPDHKTDQSHQVNLRLDHAFSERYKIELSDSFAVAQEPSVIDQEGLITTPIRTEGDNMRNRASIDFTAQLSRQFSVVLGYMNNYYDYEQEGVGSRSALLDRIENYGRVDLQWQVLPQTIGVLGYRFGIIDYTGDDSLDAGGTFISPDVRDNYSHYVYIGADQNFNPQLNGSARVGVQHADYHEVNEDRTSPYVEASLTYTYNPGSYLMVGGRYAQIATDVAGFNSATDVTLAQEAATVFASLSHKITAKLTGSLIGQYQHSTFIDGPNDDDSDDLYLIGLNFTYRFNPHWSAEAGYNFDDLDSDIKGRSYDRNRVYVGVRATY